MYKNDEITSYNQAADDIILIKCFSIVLSHTVGGLLAFSRVRKRKLLLTWMSQKGTNS